MKASQNVSCLLRLVCVCNIVPTQLLMCPFYYNLSAAFCCAAVPFDWITMIFVTTREG